MDLLKGLENGFYHTLVTGSSEERDKIFKRRFKNLVDNGKIIRDIREAPRDARYLIDHYYNPETSEPYTVKFTHIDFHLRILKHLNIDENFNWKKILVDNKQEYTYNDITIGYGEYKYELYGGKKVNKFGFYFKHSGKINTLKFNYSPKLVDYSNTHYAKYKDKEQYYDSIDDLLHNIRYYIGYKGILDNLPF